MTEGAECQYLKDKEYCQGNVQMQENFDMTEMPMSEYKSTLDKWQKEKDEENKKEDNKIKEDDWECQKCGAVNTMDKKDAATAYCKQCRTKNEMIEFMIKFANDNESTK